ncbi:MAG: GNAT family N-acetyltransferase [Xylophilus ampelinus]
MNSDNIERFAALYLSVFNSPPWNDGWSSQAVTERLSSFAAMPTFTGLGMEKDGTPVGLVLGWGERWVRGWVFHLKEMCVAAPLQRLGTGSRLMREFEQRLRAQGFRGVTLQTGAHAPARSFYLALGYEPINLVVLGKSLNGKA